MPVVPVRGGGGSTQKQHFQPFTPPAPPEAGQPSRTFALPTVPAVAATPTVTPTALLSAPSVSAGNLVANVPQVATLVQSVAIGEVVKVWVVTGGSGQVVTVTDSGGNTYVGKSVLVTATTIETGQMFEAVATTALTGGTSTISVARTSAGSLGFIALKESGGMVSGGVVQHDNGGVEATNFSSTAGNPVGTALTIGTTGSTTIAGIGWGNITGVLTPSAGWTLLQQAPMSGTGNPRSLAVIYRTSTSPETVTPGGTLSTGNTYVVAALADMPSVPIAALSATSTLTVDATTSSANSTASLSGSSTLTIDGAVTKAHPTHARIGDSLTWRGGSDANPPTREATTRALDLSYAITANASSEFWYAVGGKPMSGNDSNGHSVFTDISAAQAQLGTPDTWFIGLGTNDVGLSDAAFISAVQAIMTAIGSTGQVFWMNLAFFNVANTNAGHFNPILASTLSAYSNVTFLDWNTYIHSAGVYDTADWISPVDATHMTPQGWAKRDNFIDTAIALATQSAVAMTATSTLTISGTVDSGSTGIATASGSLALGGTVGARAASAATGSLDLAGTGLARSVATAAGSISLAGTGGAQGIGTGVGSLTLAGTVPAAAASSAAGAMVLVGSATARASVSAAGALVLSGAAASTVGAVASGSIALAGTGTAAAAVVGSGALALSGSLAAAVRGAASGSLVLSGSATATVATSAAGSLALTGSATAATLGGATANGSLALSGTLAATVPSGATGSLALVGSTTAAVQAVAAGALALTGSAGARATAVSTSGSIALSGTLAASAPAAASGSVTLSGSAVAAARAVAAGAIAFAGSAPATVPVAASGSVTLAGSATATVQGGAVANGSLTLSGTGTLGVSTVASGSLSLGGTVAARTPVAASGSMSLAGTGAAASVVVATGSVIFSGSTGVGITVAATGSLSMSGSATATTGPTEFPFPYYQDFTGSDGAPWPAPWETVSTSGGLAKAELSSNRGSLSSLTGAALPVVVLLHHHPLVDQEVMCDVTAGDATDDFSVILRATTAVDSGVRLTLTRRGTTWGWVLDVGTLASATVLGSNASFLVSATVLTLRLRYQVVGTSVRMRLWDAAGAEPGAWTADLTQSAVSTSGYVGVSGSGAN